MWNWAAWPSLEQLRPTTPAMPMPYSLKHSHTRPLSFRHPTAYYAVTPSSVYAFLDLQLLSYYFYQAAQYAVQYFYILLLVYVVILQLVTVSATSPILLRSNSL